MSSINRILVTGAAGHLGTHLVPELLREGFEVTGVDLLSRPAGLPAACRFLQVDLSDAAAVKDALAGAEMVLHCASIHPWKPYTDDQYLDCNVKSAWHLYTAAAELGIDRVVLTSSIAAAGYCHPPAVWPIPEERQTPLGDLYSMTKHAQEDIARMFAQSGRVRTLALRPPAFMPVDEQETGFRLTGNYGVVEDVASAHLAAVQVLAGRHQPALIEAFEAVYVTNRLPYTAADAPLLETGMDVKPLVRKYWPQAYDRLVERGYQGTWLVGSYDLSKAKRVLGWEPAFSFDEWLARNQ